MEEVLETMIESTEDQLVVDRRKKVHVRLALFNYSYLSLERSTLVCDEVCFSLWVKKQT
jgi:hypothetical protein